MKHDEQCWKNQARRDLGVGYKIASCTCGLDALLRVARAAKGAVYHMQMCGDESDAQRNLLEALKEVEHLLE